MKPMKEYGYTERQINPEIATILHKFYNICTICDGNRQKVVIAKETEKEESAS